MIKVFFLIFEPTVAWEKIAHARRGIIHITVVQLLPLLLLGTLLEAWGLDRHGKWLGQYHMYKTFLRPDILTFETIQFFLLLAMIFVCALMVYHISHTFLERLSFLQAYTTVAYAFTPMLLFHLLDASAGMHPAVPWLMGVTLAMWILYQGIPRVMQPDPTHAFGVYLSTIIVVFLTSGAIRTVTGMYLLGYMDFHNSWLARHIARLLGQ